MIRRILGGIHLTQEELEQVILTLAGLPAQDHQISSSKAIHHQLEQLRPIYAHCALRGPVAGGQRAACK